MRPGKNQVRRTILVFRESGAFLKISQLRPENRLGVLAGPYIHKFLAVVTHPRIYWPPTPLSAAIGQVEACLESPSLVLLAETEAYWGELRATLEQGRIADPQVHDAHVAALCRDHGVRESWTSDRDFSRFPQVKVVNPLVS